MKVLNIMIYMEKRIKRGTFRSKNRILMHADLNAVYNIIKKAVPEAFADGIEGIGLYPRSLSISEFTGMITWLTEIVTLRNDLS